MPSPGQGPIGTIDIGGTKIFAVVYGPDNQELGRKRRKTKAKKGFETVLDRAVKGLRKACEDADLSLEDLRAVGAGIPSPILPDGTAVVAPNLGWENVPLVPELARRIGRPVYAENDCNLGTLGEYACGAGRQAELLVGLFMGTGLGGGIVFRGEMIRGASRMSAELGHVIVLKDGREAGCGQHGCVEAYASKTGMANKIREAVAAGRKTVLTDKCKGDYGTLKAGALRDAYHDQDEVAVEALHEACEFLGLAIGNYVTALGPDVVVLGGGVIEALGEELIGRIRDAARRWAYPPASFDHTDIRFAGLGDDMVVVGAREYARQCLAGEPDPT